MASARIIAVATSMGWLVACSGPQPEPSCGSWYPDVDRDGFGDESQAIEVCAPEIPPATLVTRGGDCNDQNPSINEAAIEICDGTGVDEDCDGRLDGEDDNLANGRWGWPDADGDGYGRTGSAPVLGCEVPEGFAPNDTDCDDTDDHTFPGVASGDSTMACMTDADGDGFGSDAPAAPAVAGTDCDDTDPGRSPGAAEQLDDGIDQTCDGSDAWFVREDFDDGSVDPTVVDTLSLATLSQTFVFAGTHSLRLTDGAAITLRELGTLGPDDGGSCETLRWSFFAWRGDSPPGPGTSLTLQRRGSAGFEDVYVLGGNGLRDDLWSYHEGVLTSADAYRSDLQLRLQAITAGPAEAFFVDDIEVACTGEDVDSDGFGSHVDCAVDDPAHWLDCGECRDDDGDDFGFDCDLGPDCNDGDAGWSPMADDGSVDGADQNCDGIDGPAFMDRFEAADGVGWDAFAKGASYASGYVAAGYRSLQLTSTANLWRASPLDTSGCSEVGWVAQIRRGPVSPDPTSSLAVTWSDGSSTGTWVEVPGGLEDARFERWAGVVTDSAALTSALSVGLARTGTKGVYYVDDLAVGCDPQDHDRDGFWGGLEDCDDLNGNIHPGADDRFGDELDSDCDGIDG